MTATQHTPMQGDPANDHCAQECCEQDGEPIRPLRILNTLLRGRWAILGVTLAFAGASAGYVMTVPPTYTATAKFMPSQGQGASARMGAIAGSSVQVSDVLVENTAPEYYTELLTSRPFLEKLLTTKFTVPSLGETVPFIDTMVITADSPGERQERALESLRLLVKVSSVKVKSVTAPPILTLTMSAGDAALAADAANALVAELVRYNKETRSSKAAQNREFIERQLGDAQAGLNGAEKALAEFNRLNRRIATPSLQAEQERLARAVKVQEEVYVTLVKQLEIARIQEQDEQVSIEVIERAVAPLVRSAPRRTQTVLAATFVGGFVACGLVLLVARLRSGSGADPDVADFKDNMRSILRELTFGILGRAPTRSADAAQRG